MFQEEIAKKNPEAAAYADNIIMASKMMRGPTALSLVAIGLTGDGTWTPASIIFPLFLFAHVLVYLSSNLSMSSSPK